MFGWLRKRTRAELIEERLDDLEAEVIRVSKERQVLEKRTTTEVERRRATQKSAARTKAKVAVTGGFVALTFVAASVWEKTIFIAHLSLANFALFSLGAFVVAWIAIHLAWPDPQT